MTVRAVFEPARSLGEGSDTPVDASASPLVEALREVYVRRIEVYHREYAWALGSLPADQPDVPVSAFKVVPLRGEDGTVEEIVLDDDLFATLLDVYLCDGWQPIADVVRYARLKAHPEGRPAQSSAGTPALPWLVAYEYLIFVRNMLAILIRDALMDIEYRAAVRIGGQLGESANRLSTAVVKEFGITKNGGTFSFGNKPLMMAVTKVLGDVVAQRVRYDAIVTALRQLGAAIATVRARETTSNVPATPEKSSRDIAAEMDALNALGEATLKLHQAAKETLAVNAPLAMLIVDGLKQPVEQKDVEEALGTALWTMYQKVDDIYSAVDPDTSVVATLLPGLPGPPRPVLAPDHPTTAAREIAVPIDPHAIQDMGVPEQGPERVVIEHALNHLSHNHALFPLMHEQTWRILAARGEIPVDSFTYVVYNHYQFALAERLIAADRGQKAVAEFFATLGWIASIFSVAMLLTPMAATAPVFAGATAIADAALMAYQVSSVVSQLREYDLTIDTKVASADAVGVPGLAEIGSLMVARSEFAREMTLTLLKELLMMVLLPQWRVTKQALIMRGFINDLETIMGTDDADDAGG
jgi:hypothetical protein